MDDMWLRFVDNLADRITGPMKFRLVLQPVMASIFAIIDGLKDARAAKPPYFWALFSHPQHRGEMVRDGWKSIGKVFIVAILIDVVYQIYELHFIYPGEALAVAFILAIVPYLLLRGPVNRIGSRK